MERYGFPITDTRALRTDSLTTLLGAELHAGRTELGHLWHILAVGLPMDFRPPTQSESGQEIAARALASGAFVAAAHPAWYGLTEGDIRSLGEIHAIEIYNGTSHDHNDRADSVYMLDMMSMRGHKYTACATDDSHFFEGRTDFRKGWVYVAAERNEPDSLLEALKRGDYYSSTGPEIYNIRWSGVNTISIDCSPVERIFAQGHGHSSSCAYGDGIKHAEIELSPLGDSAYVRISVRDSHGARAWTNPIWR